MGKSIGIYFGERYSAVAFKDTTLRVIPTGPNNEELCRTCVALDSSGNFIAGNAAFDSWKKYTPNIVLGVRDLLGASISDPNVQKMKADKVMYPYGISKKTGVADESIVVILNGKEYTPEQISSVFFRQLKNDASIKLGGEVTQAVITIPANFNDKQKKAIWKAANLADLQIQRLVTEPIAAAISFGANKMGADKERIFLVYDLSYRRFNISILVSNDGYINEIGAGGDHWLGSDDFDLILSDYVKQQIERNNNLNLQELLDTKSKREVKEFKAGLKADVENAKKTLSQSTSATIFVSNYLEDENDNPIDDIIVTRDTFESLIRPLIQRTILLIDQLLVRTCLTADDLSNIYIVGGLSIPLIRKMLCNKFDKAKVLLPEKPLLAFTQGAAILSNDLETDYSALNVPLVTV